MAARQLAGRRPLYFSEVCFYPLTLLFFLPPNLRGPEPIVIKLCKLWSTNGRNRTVGQNLVHFGLYCRDLLGEIAPNWFWGRKTQFSTTPFCNYCKYLQTRIRYHRLENAVANCVPNLVNFGPLTAKSLFWVGSKIGQKSGVLWLISPRSVRGIVANISTWQGNKNFGT